MHELIEQELYGVLRQAKTVDEEQGKRFMIQFEIDQPILFQTVFNTFASIIGQRHEELAHVFMDLCFEVLCVYQFAFGKMPKHKDDPNFMERQIALFDKELKPLLSNKTADAKRAQRMKEKFFDEPEGETSQHGLIRFLNQSVDEYAADETNLDNAAIEMTKTMLFVVVRLFTNLYTKTTLH